MAEKRENPEWVAARLLALDDLFEEAIGRQIVFGQGAAAMLVEAPDVKGAVSASQHAAELRGLLGAAAKSKAAAPPVPDAAWERMTAAEKLEQLDAARADVLAEAEREQRSAGRH